MRSKEHGGQGEEIKVGHSNLKQAGRVRFRGSERKRKSDAWGWGGGVEGLNGWKQRGGEGGERKEANSQWAEVMKGETRERESSGRNE